jgi:hypothetical protein
MVDSVTNHIMNHFSNKCQAVMVVVGYMVDHYCLAFVREVVHDVIGYMVDHYCLAFVREITS